MVPETKPGDDVVIIGPGLRAMASVIAAKEAGARNIIVVGRARNPLKIEIVEAFGATHFIRLDTDDVRAQVNEITGGLGAHRVIDYVPHVTETFELAMDVARPGGTIVPVGFKGHEMPFVVDRLCEQEAHHQGSDRPVPGGVRPRHRRAHCRAGTRSSSCTRTASRSTRPTRRSRPSPGESRVKIRSASR